MKITLNKFQKAVRNVPRWAVTCGALPFGLMAFVHCSQPKLSKLVLPLDSPSTRMRVSINLTLNPWLVCLPDKWACISILLCFCACVIYPCWGLWSPNGAQHEETPPHCHLELPRRAPHLTSYLNNTIKDDQFADVLRVWLVHVHFPKILILQGRARARPVLCLLVRCFTKGLGKRHPCVYVFVRVVCVQHGWWIGVISGYRVVILLPRQTAALMSGAGVS